MTQMTLIGWEYFTDHGQFQLGQQRVTGEMYKGGNYFMEIENCDVLVIFLDNKYVEVSLTSCYYSGRI